MSIQDAANAAKVFPSVNINTPNGVYTLPVVMVAIAGAESGFDPSNKGDYGLGGPNCDGSTSWGLWQIHNVHSAYLTQQTGSTNPCTWEQWCFNPTNNGKAALAIMQGYSSPQIAVENAWYTTWHEKKYVQYLNQAQSNYMAITTGVTQTPLKVYQAQSTTPSITSPVITGKVVEYGVFAVLAILGLVALKTLRSVIRSV